MYIGVCQASLILLRVGSVYNCYFAEMFYIAGWSYKAGTLCKMYVSLKKFVRPMCIWEDNIKTDFK